MLVQDLDTPCAVVDLDVMESNLRRCQAYIDRHGLRLRTLPIGRSSPNSGSRRMGRRPVEGRHSARGLAEAATPPRGAG